MCYDSHSRNASEAPTNSPRRAHTSRLANAINKLLRENNSTTAELSDARDGHYLRRANICTRRRTGENPRYDRRQHPTQMGAGPQTICPRSSAIRCNYHCHGTAISANSDAHDNGLADDVFHADDTPELDRRVSHCSFQLFARTRKVRSAGYWIILYLILSVSPVRAGREEWTRLAQRRVWLIPGLRTQPCGPQSPSKGPWADVAHIPLAALQQCLGVHLLQERTWPRGILFPQPSVDCLSTCGPTASCGSLQYPTDNSSIVLYQASNIETSIHNVTTYNIGIPEEWYRAWPNIADRLWLDCRPPVLFAVHSLGLVFTQHELDSLVQYTWSTRTVHVPSVPQTGHQYARAFRGKLDPTNYPLIVAVDMQNLTEHEGVLRRCAEDTIRANRFENYRLRNRYVSCSQNVTITARNEIYLITREEDWAPCNQYTPGYCEPKPDPQAQPAWLDYILYQAHRVGSYTYQNIIYVTMVAITGAFHTIDGVFDLTLHLFRITILNVNIRSFTTSSLLYVGLRIAEQVTRYLILSPDPTPGR